MSEVVSRSTYACTGCDFRTIQGKQKSRPGARRGSGTKNRLVRMVPFVRGGSILLFSHDAMLYQQKQIGRRDFAIYDQEGYSIVA